ncbi:hypothetical protein E4U92_35335 [Streptomyces galbus]|uniref:Uncharacterized protein n=1 Tax=Streptomyces galbus TaxID=33898 RepID=A0A4U5W5K2_STRGB|nr:hypothetical protein E4U92_35335 [Streptomyces galbus]
MMSSVAGRAGPDRAGSGRAGSGRIGPGRIGPGRPPAGAPAPRPDGPGPRPPHLPASRHRTPHTVCGLTGRLLECPGKGSGRSRPVPARSEGAQT